MWGITQNAYIIMPIEGHTIAEWEALLSATKSPEIRISATAQTTATPADAYATYRALTGNARFKFYAKNAATIWAGYEASLQLTQK